MGLYTVVIPVADRSFPAQLALPERGPSPAPGVLFFHGSDGYGAHHADLAQLFAGAGYATLAPTWFGAGGPHPHWDGLVTEDLHGFWQYLGNRPEVDPGRWAGALGLKEMTGLGIQGGAALEFVGTITAPILSFHGEADTVVPAADTRRLDAACRQLGVRHRAHFYPGIGHSFLWRGNDQFHGPTRDDALTHTLEFLAHVLAPDR